MKILFLVFFVVYSSLFLFSQPKVVKQRVYTGVYYFGGWTYNSDGLNNKYLLDSFQDRESIWGWATSSYNPMKAQINLAVDAGVDFFDFCWYYPAYNKSSFQSDSLNYALNLYLKVKENSRLKFAIMVANHEGYEIGPNDWKKVSDVWINLFKNKNYFKINGKPYLLFFSVGTLINNFGGIVEVKNALINLKKWAKLVGIKEILIGACINPDVLSLRQAEACGFDLTTGYNYHGIGLLGSNEEYPLSNLINNENATWIKMRDSSLIPYIPVSTLGWDNRPWVHSTTAQRYVGFSPVSVFQSITSIRKWTLANSSSRLDKKVAMIYAWNEYGEGAWLTPSKLNNDSSLLKSFKKAMK